VVVGNLKGAAGYGMGKGKTSKDAINSAFRSLNSLKKILFYSIIVT
jgi:ribosomal protein S5